MFKFIISKGLFCWALVVFSFFTLFGIAGDGITSGGEIKIGILAKRGKEITYQRWNDMADYLKQNLPYRFTIVPLTFEEIEPAIKTKQIDFLLANSGIFVNLSFKYNLTAISTVKRKILNHGYTNFGGVVFTRSDNKTITSYNDLYGKDFAAVNKTSLGGWIMALREFHTDNINPDKFRSLKFLGTHDAVVNAVVKGEVDAGTVRTDTLERMASEGKVDLKLIKPIGGSVLESPRYAQDIARFPFIISTRLYPEWPFAKLNHITDELGEAVATVLITLPHDSLAAKSAQITGWTIPKNYREVELAYSELKLGVFKELTSYTFSDVFKRYWQYFLTAFFISTIMALVTIYIIHLNNKLKESQKQLNKMATHDSLTGLPNRILFKQLGQKCLNIAERDNRQMMIMFMDLDKFKLVNDTFGHDSGDFLLKKTAERISSVIRKNDIIARIGGDEFIVMLWDVDSVTNAHIVMKRLIDSVSLPMLDEKGNKLQVGVSIGASRYPDHGKNLEDLSSNADLALYDAKESGRGKIVFYDPQKHSFKPELKRNSG